jgi:adenylate cyclase
LIEKSTAFANCCSRLSRTISIENVSLSSDNPSPALVDKVADWLMDQSLTERELEFIVMGCCERLQAAGLPLVRAFFAFSVLHPLHAAIGITWMRGTGTAMRGYPHVPGGRSEQYRQSPFAYMDQRGLDLMHISLTGATTTDWRRVGEYELRGVGRAMKVVAPIAAIEL